MNHARSQDRIDKINELSAIVSENNRKLDSLLEELKWDRHTLQGGVTMATCPLDKNHHVPAKSLDEHIKVCKWLKQGYSKQDLANKLPSSHFYYKNSLSVVPVLIDQTTQSKIISSVSGPERMIKDVPLTMERAQSDLTSAERLAIYDYVVDTAKKTNKQPSVSSSELEFDPTAAFRKEEKKHPKTHMEVLAEKRDYKRRRQSYRGKNVHITRKSQTDMMREVIDAYMDLIGGGSQDDGDNDDDDDDGDEKSQTGELHGEHSRSPSTHSRSPSWRRNRDRSRSPDRKRSHDRGQRSSRRKHSDDSSHGNSRDKHKHRKKHKHSDRETR
ncbi:U11/U12 small nuclear ribonucleoprotein 48 kDa protein-like [Glandiceps talaboti]